MSAVLTIPPQTAADIERAKDFLFTVYGEGKWTEESYLDLSDRVNRLIEYSAGRLVVFPMPTSDHQDIVGRLYIALVNWARDYGGRAFVAAFPIRLGPEKFREPDVLLYRPENVQRVKKQYGEPPDLVVEVLSPGTKKTDLEEKVVEYAEAGISEYWIVDTESVRVWQYVLAGDRYELRASLGEGDTLRAMTFEGLEIPVERIYEV